MKTNGWIVTTVLTGLLWVGTAVAGDLTPPGAPGPTMYTLEEIYQRLAVLESNQTAIEGKLTSAGLQQTSGGMVLIPAGSFVMGATTNVGHESYGDELPQHTVSVSAFYMDKYEVTSNLWREVYTWATNKGYAFANVGLGKSGTHPVQMVNWYDAIAWCNARSVRDGFAPCYTNANGTVYTNAAANSFTGGCNWAASGYRLPTEAEWEKTARGGVANRRFPWDDANTIQHARANYYAAPASYTYDTSPTPDYHPSYNTGEMPYTSPVGSFTPNGYGLYDMAGNVWEWCWDWYSPSYYYSSPGSDPRGPTSGSYRVLRGGAWYYHAYNARVAYRNFDLYPDNESNIIGFRCARGR
jgi:formylglycine-generating enzyme required for sulfatase activity